MRHILLLSSLLFVGACTQSETDLAEGDESGDEKADDGGASTQAGVTETTMALPDGELPTMALAEHIKQINSAEATGKLITSYTGGIVAPFTTYAIVFDPEPQDGGDYGSFRSYRITGGMKNYPTNASIKRVGNQLVVSYKASFADFDSEGNDRAVTRTVTAKFDVNASGALAASGTVSY